MQSFKFETLLNISREKLWEGIWNFKNINKELSPYFRMTAPEISLTDIDVETIPLNQALFKSNIFFLKIIPIDIHHFMLKDIKEFEFFSESSTSLMMKKWNHKRTLESKGEQTLLIDEIEYLHRANFIGKITLPIYKSLFAHRHKKLRLLYS